ncbi:MAG: hypothetical protein KKH20_01010 [Proteobacteria bacterium]|nr:hypothetical protein [Pseudomonadota bacterium]
MHSWRDRTEYYDRRFYPMGQGSQVWARGSGLESDEEHISPNEFKDVYEQACYPVRIFSKEVYYEGC